MTPADRHIEVVIIDDAELNTKAAEAQFKSLAFNVTGARSLDDFFDVLRVTPRHREPVSCAEPLQCNLTTAASLEQFIKILYGSSGPFDVVLTDLYMPMSSEARVSSAHQAGFMEGPIATAFPMGIFIAEAACASGVPYVGVLSSKGSDGRQSLPLDYIDPLLWPAGAKEEMRIVGNSLCYRTNDPQFSGWLAPNSSEVLPDAAIDRMCAEHGWSLAEKKRLLDLHSQDTRDVAAGRAYSEYKAKNPCKDYRRVKNWQALLDFMISHDSRLIPQRRQQRDLVRNTGKAPASLAA